jgi:integrase
LARYQEKVIKKFLSQSQMAHLWDIIGELELKGELNQLPAVAFKLLMLTGARKNEILPLK